MVLAQEWGILFKLKGQLMTFRLKTGDTFDRVNPSQIYKSDGGVARCWIRVGYTPLMYIEFQRIRNPRRCWISSFWARFEHCPPLLLIVPLPNKVTVCRGG